MEILKNNPAPEQEDEFNEAVREAEADPTTEYVHEFKKPFTWMGKTYEKLHFDFDMLTGRDSLAIENELQALGIMVMVPTFSGPYLLRVAAKACKDGLGVDAFEAMRISDYNRIRAKVRNFLLTSEQ